MLNSKKFLYLLPDTALIAELLPAKTSKAYSIVKFKQINGEFIKNNNFVKANLTKLFTKLESKDPYQLILADALFTNTIIDVKESSEAKVKTEIKDKLLPDLKLDTEKHQVEAYILTKIHEIYKVQLCAIENSLLSPLKEVAAECKINLLQIYPLSWTFKSIISLEPSLSLVQVKDYVYLAEQFIGIDQTSTASINDLKKIVESVKTLKGSEPGIQSLYLLTEENIEKALGENLKSVLPIQQVSKVNKKTKLASHLKTMIESFASTQENTAFQLPEFTLDKIASNLDESTTKDVQENSSETIEKMDASEEIATLDTGTVSDLPKPGSVSKEPVSSIELPPNDQASGKESKASEEKAIEEKVDSEEVVSTIEEVSKSDIKAIGASVSMPKEVLNASQEASKMEADSKSTLIKEEDEDEEIAIEIEGEETKGQEVASPTLDSKTKEVVTDSKEEDKKLDIEINPPAESTPSLDNSITTPGEIASEKIEVPTVSTTESAINLSQFSSSNESTMTTPSTDTAPTQVIKNKDGLGKFFKVILIFFISVAITVAIGVGIGFGILKFTNKTEEKPAEVTSPVVAEPTALPKPTATPTPAITIAKDAKILIVNATTISGYAGKIKTKLTEAGYTALSTGNAKGEYDPGVYLLMKEDNDQVVDIFSEATDLKLSYLEGKDTEDPKETYEYIIILAE